METKITKLEENKVEVKQVVTDKDTDEEIVIGEVEEYGAERENGERKALTARKAILEDRAKRDAEIAKLDDKIAKLDLIKAALNSE